MKVLFVGEGRHDIGEAGSNPYHPRKAEGTIPALVRQIDPTVSPESIALAWTDIPRFSPSKLPRGYADKVLAGALLAVRKFDCQATVVVADRDRDESRNEKLRDGASRANALFPHHPVVYGVAVESVEAWILGAPRHIAEELGIEEQEVLRHYPKGIHVEDLCEKSGKSEHHPKKVLERVAESGHRVDCTEFRKNVAQRTDVNALAKNCPAGFAPFADQIRGMGRYASDTR